MYSRDFDQHVTFGSSGLDRDGLVRDNADQLNALWRDPARVTVVFWRGQALMNNDGTALARLVSDHPLLPAAREDTVYLGRDGASPVFAAVIADWPEVLNREKGNPFLDQRVTPHPLVGVGGFSELRSVMTRISRRDAELAASARSLFEYHRTHVFCARCGGKTEMTEGGWRRRCLDCDRPHFPRSDPVVIMLVTRGNDVLLGRSPGWPDGMYSLLAGFVEPGETVENAVRREVFEEAGISVGPVRYLGSQPWAFPASLMLGYQGHALDAEIAIDPKELDDAKWVSKEELLSDMSNTEPSLKAARKGAIAHHILRGWVSGHYDGPLPWN
ncbi:MAG: NAD(+) diphosphatase [Pseudomonadota bacterium]